MSTYNLTYCGGLIGQLKHSPCTIRSVSRLVQNNNGGKTSITIVTFSFRYTFHEFTPIDDTF